jgi:Leucine-rich repeat (LRR) protein
LTGLYNLQTLGLSENQVEDIEYVQSLMNIQFLFLSSNNIKNVTPLVSLQNLQMVDLRNNRTQNTKNIQDVLNNNKGLHKIITNNELPIGVNGNIYMSGNPIIEGSR